jgi:hypothetical protein
MLGNKSYSPGDRLRKVIVCRAVSARARILSSCNEVLPWAIRRSAMSSRSRQGTDRVSPTKKLRNGPNISLIQHDFASETNPITVADSFLARDDATVGRS